MPMLIVSSSTSFSIAIGVASIFVFRKRGGDEYKPTFRTPLYPLTPIVFVIATAYLLGNALIDPGSRGPTLAVFGVILLGIPVYYLTVGRGGGSAPELASPRKIEPARR